jgi:Protein of unknown function (DUF3605)
MMGNNTFEETLVDKKLSSHQRHPPEKNNNNNIIRWVTIENPNVAVTLPTLEYGYRTTKLTWDELQQIISQQQQQQHISKLSRSVAQQREYEIFRHHMKQQYTSSLDFLLISKFGIGVQSAQQFPYRAAQSLAEMKEPMTRLVPNDFPYYVQDGIHHYIFWKTKEPITEEEISSVKDTLRKDYGAIDILHWINPPALQSLPEIDHVHFLFR